LTPILAALDDVSTKIAELLPIEGNDQTTHRREGTEANRMAACVTRTAVQKLGRHLQLRSDPDYVGVIQNASLTTVQNIGVARVRQTINDIDSWFNSWLDFEADGELEVVPDFPAELLAELTSVADALHRLGSAPTAEPTGKETPKGAQPTGEEPVKHQLTVDLKGWTVTLDTDKYDVKSEQALRWVKVLVEHPGEWISGKELESHDPELIGARTYRLKQHLPKQILDMIDSETGRGSRIRLVV